jgi:hypothetical protein
MNTVSKLTAATLLSVAAATSAHAAQSIEGWACENNTWEIEMNEAVSGSPSISVNSTALTGAITKSSGDTVLTTSVSSCPNTMTALSVTIGSDTYSWSF